MSLKVLIVEDEKLAAERLRELIERYSPHYDVLDCLDSVESAVSWFRENVAPDLVFLDIHLADGISFEIFEAIDISPPIIFCTAYDQYAIQAFKVNSIDYLLKPIDETDLNQALFKFEEQLHSRPLTSVNIEELVRSFSKPYKSRFVIKVGEHLHAVEVNHIRFFHSEEKATYLHTDEGKKYLIDFPLDRVETMVDPDKFFRINRKYLVSFPAILDILTHSNSRLRLVLAHSKDDQIIVSRERVQEFKSWLDN